MFSYRHAFHAGNHADVLKHTTLIAVLRHLSLKPTALHGFDTHAGAGLYRLDGDYASTSGEAAQGYLRLLAQRAAHPEVPLHPLLQDYLDVVAAFNPDGGSRVYPGSPFIVHHLLQGRDRDRLKVCELHPTDARTLTANLAQLDEGRRISVLTEDGFEALRRFLPPPSRRGFVLCDPSYELKSDYARVPALLEDALGRFPTGSYLIWYPIIGRTEAHALPRKLKALAGAHQRSWLNATLTVKSSKIVQAPDGSTQRPGLPASGVFVVNPPFTLAAALRGALAQLVDWLGQERNRAYTVESGEGPR
ncbi:MAG: 23S rRNA (adenine(2030)-N(6))-methyltransferase RlmJ [Rhodoferax sp.]